MPEEIMNEIKFKLHAYINKDDQLVVGYKQQKREVIELRPDGGLKELTREYPTELTVEVHDFVQRGTVYEVYCATLASDGHTITSHWRRTEAGQACTFSLLDPHEAEKIKLFIGALPRRKDAPVPAPLWPHPAFGSGCVPFPEELESRPHGSATDIRIPEGSNQ
jgi:hypothetical protein